MTKDEQIKILQRHSGRLSRLAKALGTTKHEAYRIRRDWEKSGSPNPTYQPIVVGTKPAFFLGDF